MIANAILMVMGPPLHKETVLAPRVYREILAQGMMSDLIMSLHWVGHHHLHRCVLPELVKAGIIEIIVDDDGDAEHWRLN